MARPRTPRFAAPVVTVLLDTHFLIWIVLESKRLANFPWLDRYRPWGVSPVSFLEIQFLAEVGRLSVTNPQFVNTVSNDRRFIVDDLSLDTLSATR
jgi:PIN domain nuclease of toxin-antitoxin system